MSIPRRSLARSGLALCAAFLALVLSSQATLAAVTWSSPASAGPTYSWNFGQALARTKSGTTSFLHTQYTTDFVNGMFVADSGPYLGVYYRRGNSNGTTWSSTKRLNGSMEHAANGALAASGQNVYVAYSVLSGILDSYDPAAPRLPRVAVNTNYGTNTAWLTPKSNFIQTRIDRPAVAAAGAWAYMVFTDADTGEIYVATNLGTNTEDSGWGGSGTVGMTTRLADDPDEGYSGMPVIAAIGNKVMVAWIGAPGGSIKAVVSPDNGTSWSDEVTLSTAQVWDLAAAGDGTRMALTWANRQRSSSRSTRAVAGRRRERSPRSARPRGTRWATARPSRSPGTLASAWPGRPALDRTAQRAPRRVSICDGASRPTMEPPGNRRSPSRPTLRRARNASTTTRRSS